MTATRELSIHGACTGTLWMPCAPGAKPFSRRLTLAAGESAFDRIEEELLRESGDFQDVAKLTADTWIELSRVSRGEHRTVTLARAFPAADLPSLAELTAADLYSSDFFGEDF